MLLRPRLWLYRPPASWPPGPPTPARIASLTTAGFSLLDGGCPIGENGTVAVAVAVAVGGGTLEQDDEVARAALQAL